MELLEPVECVGDQEVPHLGAAVVEDQRPPIGVLAEPGVFVLVQRRAVEAPEREVVLGKVRRYPVEDDADPRLMAGIDEEAEVVRRPVARGGGVVSRHLVAPRSRERVLGDRQELDVGEAEPLHVLHHSRRDLAIGERTVLVFRHPRPRSEVRLVDEHRLARVIAGATVLHPRLVAPPVAILPDDARRGARRRLHREGQRVGLHARQPFTRDDLELVVRSRLRARDEELEDA